MISRLKLKTSAFSLVFLLVFCFSGLLSIMAILNGQPLGFRIGIVVSILALPIVFLCGLRIDRVTFAILGLTVVVILSGLYNNSSLKEVFYFLRNIIYTYLIYNLVSFSVTKHNIKRIIRWCMVIAMIQLPVVLIQKSIYPQLPLSVRTRISAIDIGTGTFNINADYAMTFFLVLMIIFLLFDSKRNFFIHKKWIILAWLTLTIFVAESELVKIIVLLVWAVFFVLKLRYKKYILVFLLLTIVLGTMAIFGVFNETIEGLSERITTSLDTSPAAMERFLSGSYSRGAALKYYLSKGLFLLGDGPSKYLDIQSRTKQIGNNGHFFVFYSEVGQLGWLCSVAIFFLIAFPMWQGKIYFSWGNLLNFSSLMFVSLTGSIMTNFAVLLVYCIMSMTYLLPVGDPSDAMTDHNNA